MNFGTLKEQEPLGLGGWVVSDDHTSVQWFRRANEPQQQIGEPYLLSVDIYDVTFDNSVLVYIKIQIELFACF